MEKSSERRDSQTNKKCDQRDQDRESKDRKRVSEVTQLYNSIFGKR